MRVETIRSISEAITYEIDKIKGSRFIGYAFPVDSVEGALLELGLLKEEHPAANHHCWAWQGAGADVFRYSDDGEPGGSAGRPIYNAIKGRQLTNVAVVVVRYFGGTKLGTGGLVRAYGGAAAAVLEESDILETVLMERIRVVCDYERVGTIKALLRSVAGQISSSEFEARVSLELEVPKGRGQEFIRDAQNACAGQLEIREE